jgi:hypothetical protein
LLIASFFDSLSTHSVACILIVLVSIILKGYAEAGALDGEHGSLYRGCCQLIEVKKEELFDPWD